MRLTWETIARGCYRAHFPGGVLEVSRRFVGVWGLWHFENEDTPYGTKISDYSTLGNAKADAAARAEAIARSEIAGDGPRPGDLHAQRQA